MSRCFVVVTNKAGVDLVRAITETSHQERGWVLAGWGKEDSLFCFLIWWGQGYREDHATIFLQASRVGEDVQSAVNYLKDEEQQ